MVDDVVRHLLIRLAENLSKVMSMLVTGHARLPSLAASHVFVTSAFPSIHASFLVRDTMLVGT